MFIKGASGDDDYIGMTKEAFFKTLKDKNITVAYTPDKTPGYINQPDGLRGTEENLSAENDINSLLPPKQRNQPQNPAPIAPNVEPLNETTERTTFQPTFKDTNEAIEPAPGDEGKSLGGDPPTIEQRMHGKAQPMPVDQNSPIMQQINNSSLENNSGSPIPTTYKVTNDSKRKEKSPNEWDTMKVRKSKGKR